MSENFRKYVKKEHYPVHPSNLRFKTSFRNCIYESLKRRTWKESDDETEWDIFWTEKDWIHDGMDHMHLGPNQRINHFRNYYELCRKDNLIKNLKRHKRNLEKEGKLDDAAAYDFFPATYNLPTEYSIFCEEFKKHNNAVWIMKPIGKAQGKGIFLFNKLSQISQWKNDSRWKADGPQVENYIVQRYINNPLLIGGKKFDMRIYCLVTSYSPLVAYLYRDGFARFTHHRYDNSDITNAYVHLTNVAIQKTSENYDEKLGGKWDLRTLKLHLMSQYGQEAVSESFASIQQVIIRALQSVQKVMINDKHCFELYGFDILLDSNLKPWLIEVNGSPSMTANTPHDFELKCNLLDDVFTIIDMERILTGQEEQIGGFDLICKGTPVKNETSLFSTMLSCHNNRAQQLKKLSKLISAKLAQSYLQQEKEDAKKSLAKDKDNSSVSTTDSSNSRTKTKAVPKVNSASSTIPKPTRPSPLLKQNTLNTASQPTPNKDPNLKEPNSVIPTKPNSNRPRDSGRGHSGKATTIGLPPVTSAATTGTPVAHIAASNASVSTAASISHKGMSFSSAVNAGLGSSTSLSNSGVGKPRVGQPMQNQNSMSPGKPLSTLQMAGASLMGNKAMGNMQNMQEFLDQKQNVYSYSIGNERPGSKNGGYSGVKRSGDILSEMVGKDKGLSGKKQVNLKSEANEEYESGESGRNYVVSQDEE